MLRKLISLLLFVLATSAFAQSPYGRVLTLDPSGTQQWIDIMTVLSTYPTYHPSTPPTVWLTSGNLLSGGEFLGSTNNQPLIFKTNNTEQMRITTSGQIGIGTTSPASTAILDIVSNPSNPMGILIPRLTTVQRNAIVSPATGLLIYNTSSNTFDYYNGSSWQQIITLETDPQVGPFNTTGQVAVWDQLNGYLTHGSITDNGTSVSVGTDFYVSGNTALGFTNTNTLTIHATSTFVAAVKFPVTTVSTNTTLNNTHFLVLVDASSANVTITLPSALSNAGRMYVIMKIDGSGNFVTISPFGGQTINGAPFIAFNTQWQKYTVMSDGFNWVAWQ
jgi:hypothetical protein